MANGVKGIEYGGDLPEELRRKIEAGLQILTDRIKALVDREEWICLECSLKQAKPIVLKRM